MSEHFDAIIIGAGQAGPALAEQCVRAGRTVAIIERGQLGGTCVNVGCMPTKSWVASAQVAHRARHAASFGVKIPGNVSVDMSAVKARKDAIVATARDHVEHWIGSLPGCRLIRGHARFLAPKLVSVNGRSISGEHIFVNVGARPSIPNLPGLTTVPYLTSSTILNLETLPPHLLIIGGSYIGLEFAQMFRRFGSEVTLIERSARLLPHEDEDVSAAVYEIMIGEGVRILTAAPCVRLAAQDGEITVGLESRSEASNFSGTHLLLAVGRQPNTQDLGLAEAGIGTDAKGYINVDESLQTNVTGVWAIGECNGRSAFTHSAYNDYQIVAANVLRGEKRSIRQRTPCHALFIDPPLGRAGMTEREARESGRELRLSRRPMSRVGRAIEHGETRGFMKVIVDAETDQILGGTILGLNGDEAIHCLVDAIHTGLPYRVLRDTMHIHPTVSELIPTLLSELGEPTPHEITRDDEYELGQRPIKKLENR
jgi:pyruvate/2-oxoglutarate dehydrogenase complex dihydrolipoamide dehydrogenase (E3) component